MMTNPNKQTMNWIISGTSMRPLLSAGDVVRVSETPFGSLGIGDVILLESDDPPCVIAHRLVGWNYQGGDRYGVLKGDNSARPDSFVLTPANYRGRVSARQIPLFSRKTGRGERGVPRSRFTAVLSSLNFNIMGLRRRVKKNLMAFSFVIFPVKRFRRMLLERTRCYLFDRQPDVRRVWLMLYGKKVAEIRMVGDRIAHSRGVSFFSLIWSPEMILHYVRGCCPDLPALSGSSNESGAATGGTPLSPEPCDLRMI